MSEMVETVGGVGGACLVVTGGLAGGCLVWAYVIWPAMTENDDLSQIHNLGAWLITFLGPGEAFIGAFAFASLAAVAALVACCYGVAQAVRGDKTPNTIIDNQQASQFKSAATEIHATLLAIKKIQESNANDTNAIADEVSKLKQSFLEKGILKSEEVEAFDQQLKNIINGTVPESTLSLMDKTIESVKTTSPQTWKSWVNDSIKHSVAKVTNFFKRTPNEVKVNEEAKQEKVDNRVAINI